MSNGPQQAKPTLGWVLLVDDDSSLSVILSEALREAGFKVVQAFNATEAITKLTKQRFDCVVLDMKIPGGGGERVVHFLREDRGFNRHTPVLVISGYLDAEIVVRIRGMVSDILVKPFRLPILINKVRELLALPPLDQNPSA